MLTILRKNRFCISTKLPKTVVRGQITEFKTPEGIKVNEVSFDVPANDFQNRLFLKMHTSSINPLDCFVKNGIGQVIFGNKSKFPINLGQEGYGTVISSPSNDVKFQNGDKVVFTEIFKRSGGSHATYASIHSRYACLAPKGVSPEICGSFSFAGQTAQVALEQLSARNVKNLLVIGGGGPVGSLVIQLARLEGLQVDSMCSAEDIPFCKELGSVNAFDYKNLTELKLKNASYDAVIDCSSYKSINEEIYVKLARRNGQFVTFSNSLFENTDAKGTFCGFFKTMYDLSKSIMYYRYNYGVRYKYGYVLPNGERLNRLVKLLEKGSLHVRLDKSFTLKELKKAYERTESKDKKGKVVLILDDSPDETVKK